MAISRLPIKTHSDSSVQQSGSSSGAFKAWGRSWREGAYTNEAKVLVISGTDQLSA